MADGLVLPPGAGQPIGGAGMTLKVGAGQSEAWSVFEAEVAPGFDVGAHVHRQTEELFHIIEGELDLLAFEPRSRTAENWRGWESGRGGGVARGGPGSVMFVPAGCPHAFANPGPERYLTELAALIAGPGPSLPAAIAELRARYDIDQLTPMIAARP